MTDMRQDLEPSANSAVSIRERAVRLVFGDDVFISYSRADGAAYAAKLATALAARGFSCRFDQWGSSPGTEVPPDLLKGLKRSGLFVLLSTAVAGASPHVEAELRQFRETDRQIVPIDLDGAIRSARWWPLVEGLAVSPAEPFADVLDRVQHTITFTRRNVRLGRIAMAVMSAIAVLLVVSAVAGKRAADAIGSANRSAGDAARQSARAEEAAAARRTAETVRNQANTDAQRARELASEQQKLTNAAVAARKGAQQEVLTQQRLAREADVTRQQAEQARDVARLEMEQSLAGLKKQTDIAQSQELARLSSADPVNLEQNLRKTIQALEISDTEAARVAMSDALRRVLRSNGPAPYTADRRGRFAAAAGSHGGGYLVDLQSGVRTGLCGGFNNIQQLSFSPDGRWLLLARQTGEVIDKFGFVWDWELWDTGKAVRLSTVKTGQADHIWQWSPDSSLILVGVAPLGNQKLVDDGIRLSVSSEGQLTAARQAGPYREHDIAFSHQRRQFVTWSRVSSDQPVTLWDFAGNSLWTQRLGDVWWAAFSQDERFLVVESGPLRGAKEFTVVALDATGHPTSMDTVKPTAFEYDRIGGLPLNRSFALKELLAKNAQLVGLNPCSLELTPDGKKAACFFREGRSPIVFDVHSQEPVGLFAPWTRESIRSSIFSPDGAVLALTGSDSPPVSFDSGGAFHFENPSEFVAMWNFEDRSLRWMTSMPATSGGLRFSAAGRRLLVEVGHDARVLDWQSGKSIANLSGAGRILSVDEDGTRVVTTPGSGDTHILLQWDVDQGRILNTITMDEADKEEMKSDQEMLDNSPTAANLLSIARRRLRACEQ